MLAVGLILIFDDDSADENSREGLTWTVVALFCVIISANLITALVIQIKAVVAGFSRLYDKLQINKEPE
jgi:hypothetical protein